jgi:hypothetical protein
VDVGGSTICGSVQERSPISPGEALVAVVGARAVAPTGEQLHHQQWFRTPARKV